jgi:D-galacturonate reductase
MVEGRAVPYKVTASAGTGIATSEPFNMVDGTEDTITLLVNWRSIDQENPQEGTAVYTASWTAPKKSEVHSQQHFHYLGAKGEVRVDQGHRGYSYTTDEDGYANVNPFYMKYTPSEDGHFDGQRGYGYVSLEKFIDNCQKLNSKSVTVEDLDKRGLPTIKNTELVTAILEAGRRSLDEQRSIELKKSSNNEWTLV